MISFKFKLKILAPVNNFYFQSVFQRIKFPFRSCWNKTRAECTRKVREFILILILKNNKKHPWSRSLILDPWYLILDPDPWSRSLISILDPDPWSRPLIPMLDPDPPGCHLTWVEQVQYVLQHIHQPSSQSVCEWHRCHAEEEKQHAWKDDGLQVSRCKALVGEHTCETLVYTLA